MKKLFTFFLVILSFSLFMPISSAKFKDCWGTWQKGSPGNGDCYQASSVAPDDKPKSLTNSSLGISTKRRFYSFIEKPECYTKKHTYKFNSPGCIKQYSTAPNNAQQQSAYNACHELHAYSQSQKKWIYYFPSGCKDHVFQLSQSN